ncbi:hypothetical protein CFC21_039657 [Triticum aestivum]|uniref:F-box domain-containing protein n=2 Tax=Triticum aestivum TaxID=4565 RepID=A0A9R1JS41_WHEAT|nr:hypothetical protein CFC21_039657 [Triticum aestivum]CDM81112.1 unnamed protein product [Triticum aestivum]
MAQQQPRQIDATEEGAEAARRSGCSPAAPASPLEVEDLLREILLRLPPQPSSLPCASAVCKRWQHLVTDPKFLHCFRVHHQKPPLLGFIHIRIYDVVFTPVLDPPDRIPPQRFDLRPRDVESGTQLIIGTWGDIISGDVPHRLVFDHIPGFLVGNALYWLLDIISDGMLKFDLDEKSLAVINGPTIANDVYHASHWIIQLEDGAVAMAILSYTRFQMWQMDVSCHGVVTWMMLKTIDMHDIPGLPPQIEGNKATMKRIVGYVEDTNEFLLSVDDNVYMVQLKSM